MNLMKYAVVGVLLVIVSNAEEAKSVQSSSPLTSANGEWRQQNKRQSTYGSSNTHNSGFRPITSSYSSVNNYVGNPRPYSSATTNVQQKQPFNPYLTSSTNYGYKTPSYMSHPSYQQFHPLSFTASQPPQVAYMHQPNNYASLFNSPQQFYAQQVPFNQFAFNPVQAINPVVHAAPVASFANSYQSPTNSFYFSPQQIHKVPFYEQQPQTFNVAPYQPANYHHHVKQILPTSPPSQIVASKPVALETPIIPTASSHIEHNGHGAVSYSHYSQSGEEKPSASPLIATQTPQQVYYHQQPQVVYNGDYNKHHYASVPFASNYYQTQGGAFSYANHMPYAHISKIPYGSQPTAASSLIPSVSSYPQKVAFH